MASRCSTRSVASSSCMKSKDDEFSPFESTMPANRQQQPPQANGNQDQDQNIKGSTTWWWPMYGDSFGAAPDQAEAHQQQGEEACHAAYSTQEGVRTYMAAARLPITCAEWAGQRIRCMVQRHSGWMGLAVRRTEHNLGCTRGWSRG